MFIHKVNKIAPVLQVSYCLQGSEIWLGLLHVLWRVFRFVKIVEGLKINTFYFRIQGIVVFYI